MSEEGYDHEAFVALVGYGTVETVKPAHETNRTESTWWRHAPSGGWLSGSAMRTSTGRHHGAVWQAGRRSRRYFDQLELGVRVAQDLAWAEVFPGIVMRREGSMEAVQSAE